MVGKRSIIGFYIILVLFSFPSCVKYYKLEKEEFPQGKDLEDKKEVVDANLRKVAVYDQFATKAIFDVLWLSDETRKAYVDIHCQKRGKDEQEKKALLRRQLEENKHWNSFYVLADIRDKTHLSLTDKNSVWSLHLENRDNDKIRPISIKETDLEPEYQFIFGPSFNLLKRVYLVKFPATSVDGQRYLKDEQGFKLVFNSSAKQSETWWGKMREKENEKNKKKKRKKRKEKKGKKEIVKHEDYYWI